MNPLALLGIYILRICSDHAENVAVTEAELVRRAKEGDVVAVSELLATHATPVYRLALHMLRNQADAEDATQTGIINALTNLHRFDEQRPFAPWLRQIVAREALKVQRAERTRFAFWQRQGRAERSNDSVESAVIVRAEHQDLWRAVNRLRDDDRLVLTLTYFMGMGEADAAAALGIRRGTVKSRKHNALVRLRALVEREFPGLRRDVLERPASEVVPQ